MIESPRAMRRTCLPATAAFAGALVLALATLPSRAADVGVSISIGQPGYYGQINIGEVPQPPVVIYNAPVVIERDPHYAGPALYLRVPPGYEKHWSKHCREYGACGRPVYFVRDDWYRGTYVPHYQQHHHEEMRRIDEGHGHPDERHGNGQNDHNEHDHDHHE